MQPINLEYLCKDQVSKHSKTQQKGYHTEWRNCASLRHSKRAITLSGETVHPLVVQVSHEQVVSVEEMHKQKTNMVETSHEADGTY